MRLFTGCLASLLAASLALGAAGAPIPQNPKAEGAGAALVRLENALKAFKQSGDRSGEASTRDLLGELYERQGRYDLAQEHYTVAQNLYAAGTKSAAPPAPPGGRLPGGRVTADVSQGATAAAGLPAEASAYNARLMLAK